MYLKGGERAMARGLASRRFQARLAKKRAELVYLLWHCDAGLPPEQEAGFRKAWVGKMADCHCVPCSCFMCGNARKIWKEVTLAEMRSAQSMRDILADEFGFTA